MKNLIANTTRTIIAISSIFFILTTMASQADALSSGSELVRPRQPKTTGQKLLLPQILPPPKLPLPAGDKSWAIGILLPLSGEYAAIGQRFQRGLELALISKPTSKAYKWHLILADSAKTTPGDAINHFKDDQATIILGPIQSKLAHSAAEKAIKCNLPIILLAPQPHLTNLGTNVFQHFLSAANQAREVARFIQQKDEKRVALLHPDNDFGNDFKATFINSCLNGKTTTVKVSAYDPAETDFSAAITDLQCNPTPTTGKEIPAYPFTALVIADFYPRLRLLAPQLTFHNLDQCQLYGTRGGNDYRLENEAGSNLEGAIFFDLDLSLPQPPQTAITYRNLYLKTYQEQPSIYDAYAYDTITILNQARDLTNNAKATNLSEALLKLPPLKLATGLTKVSHEGEFSKKLCPIIFRNRQRCTLNKTEPDTDK